MPAQHKQQKNAFTAMRQRGLGGNLFNVMHIVPPGKRKRGFPVGTLTCASLLHGVEFLLIFFNIFET